MKYTDVCLHTWHLTVKTWTAGYIVVLRKFGSQH